MSLFRPFEPSAERKTISLQKTEWIQPWSVRRTLFFCPNLSHIQPYPCMSWWVISCNTMQNPSSIQPNFIWRCQHSWTRSWQSWNLSHRYLGPWGHRGAAHHPCFFFFAGKHGDNPLKLGVSWVSGFRGNIYLGQEAECWPGQIHPDAELFESRGDLSTMELRWLIGIEHHQFFRCSAVLNFLFPWKSTEIMEPR